MFTGFVLEITQGTQGGRLGCNGYLKSAEPKECINNFDIFELTKSLGDAYIFIDYEVTMKYIRDCIDNNDNVLDWCLFYKDGMKKLYSKTKYEEKN